MRSEALSLYDLSVRIQQAIEMNLPILTWVIGEISDFKENPSGHCYLELIEKDEKSDYVKAKFRGTIWARNYRSLKPYFETTTGVSLTSGIKVLVQCSVNLHPLYGLSLNIIDIDPSYTLGDLEHQRQQTISRLMEDGVIDMNKETFLPLLPKRIAIISSPTAAGYQDFTHQLAQNPFGYTFIHHLFEATMQGDKAEESITGALEQIFEQLAQWDLVAIIRGGGSQLDLSCFDSYTLATHIAQFPIPILTGIGHEKDYTIADMVAHTRLKTPTAVAEFLINRFSNAENRMIETSERFVDSVLSIIAQGKQQIHRMQLGITPQLLKRISVESRVLHNLTTSFNNRVSLITAKENLYIDQIDKRMQWGVTWHVKEAYNTLNAFQKNLPHQTRKLLERKEESLNMLEKAAMANDPELLLNKGFSITKFMGVTIKDPSQLHAGDTLETTLAKGKVISSVVGQRKTSEI